MSSHERISSTGCPSQMVRCVMAKSCFAHSVEACVDWEMTVDMLDNLNQVGR